MARISSLYYSWLLLTAGRNDSRRSRWAYLLQAAHLNVGMRVDASTVMLLHASTTRSSSIHLGFGTDHKDNLVVSVFRPLGSVFLLLDLSSVATSGRWWAPTAKWASFFAPEPI